MNNPDAITDLVTEHDLATAAQMEAVLDSYDFNEVERITVMAFSRAIAHTLDKIPSKYELALHDIQIIYLTEHKKLLQLLAEHSITKEPNS